MGQAPFLNRFRQPSSSDPANEGSTEELFYCLERKLNVTGEDDIFWSARSRRRPTSCHTAGKMLKSGYTRSGKWKSARWRKAKRDKRAGR